MYPVCGRAIYDCELETKQCENGEIVPMEYFGQYRGIGRYEMELPEKGAYLLSGLADIVTITQKEKKEVFYANGSTRSGTLRQEHFR